MQIKDFFLSIINEKSPLFIGEYHRLYQVELDIVKQLKNKPDFEKMHSPYFDSNTFKLKRNYMDLLTFKVKRSTENSIHTFINKQTEKLNRVIKDNRIKNITMIGSETDHISLHIIFINDKELKIKTQLVEVVEKKKTIQRYPTTFHDIKIGPDFFKTKSQDWLIKNF